MKRLVWDYLYLFCVAGIVFCLDQTAKFLVRTNIQPGEAWVPASVLEPYAQIVHTPNTGMALGMLQNTNGLFIALSEIICIAIVILYPGISRKGDSLLIGFGLGLVLGGAAGNLVDRMVVGYVTDIILMNLLPVFNLADAGIFLGSILGAVGLLKGKDQAKPLAALM